MPNDHTSVLTEYSCPASTWGDMKYGVPTIDENVGYELSIVLLNPKSAIFT